MKPNQPWLNKKLFGIKNILNGRTSGILVYSGTMPTSANDFTQAAHASNLLATYLTTSTSYTIASSDYSRLFLSKIPSAVSASGTGTATWFACTKLVSDSQTTADSYVFIGSVSDLTGTGLLQFDSAAFVASQSKSIYSLAFAISPL